MLEWLRLPPFLAFCTLTTVLLLGQNSLRTPLLLSPQGCRMSWMSPSYILQSSFNTSWSPLAKRYSLWLYREVGWEDANHLHGVPVLFIPGNAGSSQQVRSIAASATRQYFTSPYVASPTFINRNLKALDFFAVEFNEDLSALHAPTLNSETSYTINAIKYILSLYPPNTQIILLGHSMGGIVALSILSHQTFQNNVIKAIITMSTPHQFSPVRFDRRSEALYGSIRDAQQGLINSSVPLLSICGGATDSQVASELCAIQKRQSPYRRTVFTSALEGTWTGVGHPEIVWCHQVRSKVARAAIELGGVHTIAGTSQVLDGWFRTGPVTSREDSFDFSRVQEVKKLSLEGLIDFSSSKPVSLHYFSPPPTSRRFTLFVSRGTIAPVGPQHASPLSASVFECFNHPELSHLQCSPLSGQVRLVPNPVWGQRFPVDKEGTDESEGLAVFEADVSDLTPGRFIGVQLNHADTNPGRVIASFTDNADISFKLIKKYEPFFRTVQISQPSSIHTTIQFPNFIQSSSIAYRVKVTNKGNCSAAMIPPLILHAPSRDESHFHSSETPFYLHSHTVSSPYIELRQAVDHGLKLTVFSSGECTIDHLSINVDWLVSFGRMGLRYWIALSQWGIAVVGLVITGAWWKWEHGAAFPDVRSSLRTYATHHMPAVTLLVFVLSLFPLPSTFLLGNSGEIIFAPLAPALWILASGLVFATWYILEVVIVALQLSKRLLRMSSSDAFVVTDNRFTKRHILSMALLLFMVALIIPYQVAFLACFLLHLNTCSSTSPKHSSPSSAYRRTSSSPVTSGSPTPTSVNNFYSQQSQNQHFLLLLTWLLPFAGPVLAVWLRTLATAGYTTPFNGDHNLLSIAFWLLFVEFTSNGGTFERNVSSWKKYATLMIFLTLPIYALFHGGRYTYGVYECANMIIAWLVLARIRWF